MTLYSYLKRFKNIAWYPSSHRDASAVAALSKHSLFEMGIRVEDLPDCFIYTDYMTHMNHDGSSRFFLDLMAEEGEFDVSFTLPGDERCKATAFNVVELDPLKISFDQSLVAFGRDQYYGKVYVCDLLLEDKRFGKSIVKLVYAVVENTAFAFDFLLKKGVKVKYVVHSAYGHGFGCGISNGAFLPAIFHDLGTKYLLADMVGECYAPDVADRYLSQEQKEIVPILKEYNHPRAQELMYGYGPTNLYEVVGFREALDYRWEHYVADGW